MPSPLTMDRWKPALINAGSAVALAVAGVVVGRLVTVPVLVAVAFALGWAWWVSPLRRAQPHVDHAQALADANANDLIVYWRPGCSYCIRLWRQLDEQVRDEVTWVNVMADAEGAAFIRQFHDGDMVTPTAVKGTGRQLPATAEAIAGHVAGARGA